MPKKYTHVIPPEVRKERRLQRTFKSVPRGYYLLPYDTLVEANDLIWLSKWQPALIPGDRVHCAHFARRKTPHQPK